jgi:O-antigen/teichoic acid export membrane protein
VLLYLGRGLLQGARLFKAFAASNVLDGTLRFTSVLFLAPRFGVNGALGAIALAFAISVGYGAIVAIRHTADAEESREASPTIPSAVVATGSISLAMIALGYYDSILVKHYLAPADAGLYGVISLAGRTVCIVLSFVPIVLLPHVTERTVKGLSSRAMLGVSLVASGAITVFATAVCVVAAPLVIRLLAGPAFDAAIPLLAMYVAGASFLAVANVLAAYLIGKHDYRVVTPLSAAAAAEIAAVVYRHSTILDVVQDVLVGHAAIASVMALALFVRLIRFGDGQQVKVAA